MATLMAVKGSRDATAAIASYSKALDGAWMLYAQDDILSAPANTQFYMAKWIVVSGGEYAIKGFADDSGIMKIDGVVVANLRMDTTFPQTTVTLTAGVHRLDLYYTNVPANTPAYIAYAFYRGSNSVPEFVSTPDDWFVSDEGDPDIGEEPNPTPAMNLPVWLPRPNWADGVTESLEWLTDVLSSESGAEQRRKLRRFPRRTVEAQFLRADNDRQIIDISLAGIGRNEVLLPLFWDKQTVVVKAAKGDLKIDGVFANRWEFQAGKLALLRRAETFDFEVVAIASVQDDSLTLAYQLKNDWDCCCEIYPLSRARLLDSASAEARTRRVAGYQLRWELLDYLNIEQSWGDTPINTKSGLHVMTGLKHNWRESMQFELDRAVYLHDNSTGVSIVTDVGKNSDQQMRVNITLNGREEHHEFMKLLYAMSGQHQLFQMPTLMDELTLVADIDAAQGALAVKQTGYSMFGAVTQNIRQWVMVELNNGTRYFSRIISTRVLAGVEYLFLEQTFGNIKRSAVKIICWCPVSRLGSDSVDITHHTDIEGVSEVVLAVRGFYARRNAQPIV